MCSCVDAKATYSSVGELCRCLLETSNGSFELDYESPKSINSKAEWKKVIENAASNLTHSITLNIKNFDNNEYSLDNISDYNRSISARGNIRGSDARITYTFTYSPNYRILRAMEDKSLMSCLTNEELAALVRAYGIADDIITDDMTDYEKELAIHDYIIENYDYDVDVLADNSANVLRTHSITGLLLDGKGVCEAYANTFMLLCRIAGLDCELATGTLAGTKHEWNVVRLGGEYYNVDVTSDDPQSQKSAVYYDYFNLSDAELAKTHTKDEGCISCTGEKYNYYSYNNLVVTNSADLLMLLNDKLDRGLREIDFKTSGGYILKNADDIKAAAEGRGLYTVYVIGDYGKEGIFKAIFS